MSAVPATAVNALVARTLMLPALLIALTTSTPAQSTVPQRPAWTEPHPGIPYLPKPPLRPPNWLVEHPPVNPNATPEARALLKMLYRITGKYTLTGQHNYPGEQDFNTDVFAAYTGKTPAMYGTDWGFAAAGDKDTAYTRREVVRKLTEKFRAGHVIALCWHEVPPTMDEPVTFRGQVQSRITYKQFEELLTPGAPLNKHWLAQVDVVAEFLKQLQDARVPVLWRPLHEINGDWFWWNGVRGDATHGTKQLFRLMYDRLTNFHKLNNLLWVWNPDQPARADRQFVDYFPGIEYVDVLSFDCYGAFQQSFYDDLNALSGGKVMGISEAGNPPPASLYQTQPKWSYVMRWAVDKPDGPRLLAQPVVALPTTTPQRRGPSRADARAMTADPRMLSMQDKVYRSEVGEVLKAAGMRLPRRAPKIPTTEEALGTKR